MSFVREERVNAVRKQHLCDGCGRLIEVGGPAMRWAGMTDGEFGSAIYHPDCREAEIALNRLMDLNADEWTPLRDIEGEDRPWLEQEFPNVAARMFRRPIAVTTPTPETIHV